MNENNNIFLNQKNVSGFSFFLMIAVYVFISFFGQLITFAIFGEGTIYLIVCSTFSSLSMAIVLGYILLKRKTKILTGLSIKPFKLRFILLAITLSFGMLFGLGFINDAVVKFLSSLGLKVRGVSIRLNSPLHLVAFSIVLSLLPAIFEECFFRGFMLGNLKGTKTWWAILSVSVCFALYHKSVAQFLYQFIYGMFLCLLFNRSKSVFPCIIAHFLNNFAVLFFEYFKFNINLYNPILLGLGLTVLAFTVGYLVLGEIKAVKYHNEEEVYFSIKDFWLPFALFGVVLCLVLFLGNLFGV